jgi:hypothetical protein
MKCNKYNNNRCWDFILLWFYTMNQMHIKHVLKSVWIECSVKEGKSSLSMSGKHEFKWYSANGSTLMLLRRTYPSYSLHSASRSQTVSSKQLPWSSLPVKSLSSFLCWPIIAVNSWQQQKNCSLHMALISPSSLIDCCVFVAALGKMTRKKVSVLW